MVEDFRVLIDRLYICRDNISKLHTKSFKHKRTLLIMYDNVCVSATEVSKEDVECRRLHTTTEKYHQNLAKFQNSLETLEHYITMVYLILEE